MVQSPSLAAERVIPQANSFFDIASLSLQKNIPAVVFVTRDGCPYCRTLRDQVLEPMLAADKFEQRAILVEVNLSRVDSMIGFENDRLTAKEFGEFYQAEITPTLLFLDAEGREIGKRLIGIPNLDLYGHYLRNSIDEALLAIRSGNTQG